MMKLMKLTELPQVISAVLSDGLFGAVDVCLDLETLEHPDEVSVAILVQEFRPEVGDVLRRHVMDANLAFLNDLANVK